MHRPVVTGISNQPRARALAEAPVRGVHARRQSGPVTVSDAGELEVRLVPWDTPATVSDDGRSRYQESFARSGLSAPTGIVIPVYAGHAYTPDGELARGPLVGRVDDVEDRDDGLYGRVVLAATPAAAELRELARTVGATVSVEFADDAAPRNGAVIRTAAIATGLAVMTAPHRGSYDGAEVLSVRAAPDPLPGEDDDEDDDDQGDDEGPGDPASPPPVEGAEAVGRAAIQREVRRILGRGARRVAPHPLARFESAYDFHAAARLSADDELPRLFARAYADHQANRGRALVDQITTDNTAIIQPGWLTEVFGIIDMGRPVITAIGARPLPPSGMEIDWPYFDGDLHALVGPQVAEKTEVVSVKVSLKKASSALTTYAGGSDLSWQLIRRSQPSYRDAYLRILQASYAVVTDAAASTAIAAVAGGTVPYDPQAPDPNGTALRSAIFQASAKVQVATGSPASFVLAAPDAFVGFSAMPGLVPTPYGTQNVSGTATASTLDVNISGLQVVLAPDLAAGKIIVSNRLACAWPEDGPFVVAAPDIPKLGEDVAIWGMATFAAFIPAGVVTLTDATPLAARSGSSSTSTHKK
jgi:hypothetical protein